MPKNSLQYRDDGIFYNSEKVLTKADFSSISGNGAPTHTPNITKNEPLIYTDKTTGNVYSFNPSHNTWELLSATTDLANTISGHKIGDYTNESGSVAIINETITTIVDNNNGTYTHTSEDGTTTNIKIINDTPVDYNSHYFVGKTPGTTLFGWDYRTMVCDPNTDMIKMFLSDSATNFSDTVGGPDIATILSKLNDVYNTFIGMSGNTTVLNFIQSGDFGYISITGTLQNNLQITIRNEGTGVWGDVTGHDPNGDGSSQYTLKVTGMTAGNIYTDFPGGWGGGIATYDMVGASTYFSSYLTRSDRRYKDDILPLESALDNITKLNGVSYMLKERPEMGTQYGFIAQEVETVLPDLVTTSQEGYLSLNYNGFIPMLVEAVKEQQAKINTLEEEIRKLKNL